MVRVFLLLGGVACDKLVSPNIQEQMYNEVVKAAQETRSTLFFRVFELYERKMSTSM